MKTIEKKVETTVYEYQCEHCDLIFSREDAWKMRDHEEAHIVASFKRSGEFVWIEDTKRACAFAIAAYGSHFEGEITEPGWYHTERGLYEDSPTYFTAVKDQIKEWEGKLARLQGDIDAAKKLL